MSCDGFVMARPNWSLRLSSRNDESRSAGTFWNLFFTLILGSQGMAERDPVIVVAKMFFLCNRGYRKVH
jgi:hypothetical protein